jgi:hypothetical protein
MIQAAAPSLSNSLALGTGAQSAPGDDATNSGGFAALLTANMTSKPGSAAKGAAVAALAGDPAAMTAAGKVSGKILPVGLPDHAAPAAPVAAASGEPAAAGPIAPVLPGLAGEMVRPGLVVAAGLLETAEQSTADQACADQASADQSTAQSLAKVAAAQLVQAAKTSCAPRTARQAEANEAVAAKALLSATPPAARAATGEAKQATGKDPTKAAAMPLIGTRRAAAAKTVPATPASTSGVQAEEPAQDDASPTKAVFAAAAALAPVIAAAIPAAAQPAAAQPAVTKAPASGAGPAKPARQTIATLAASGPVATRAPASPPTAAPVGSQVPPAANMAQPVAALSPAQDAGPAPATLSSTNEIKAAANGSPSLSPEATPIVVNLSLPAAPAQQPVPAGPTVQQLAAHQSANATVEPAALVDQANAPAANTEAIQASTAAPTTQAAVDRVRPFAHDGAKPARAEVAADAPAAAAHSSIDAARPLPALADATPLVQTAAPAAAAPTSGSAALSSHDFTALVDRLVEAREAASPQSVHAAVSHREFGQVSLRFDQDGNGLSVAMSSSDPDFARAVQASATSAGAQTASDNAARHRDMPSQYQQTSGSPSGQPQSQAQSQASTRDDRAPQARAQIPSAARRNSEGTRRDRSDEIYA